MFLRDVVCRMRMAKCGSLIEDRMGGSTGRDDNDNQLVSLFIGIHSSQSQVTGG